MAQLRSPNAHAVTTGTSFGLLRKPKIESMMWAPFCID